MFAATTGRRANNNDPAQLTSITMPINYDNDADLFKDFINGYGMKEGYEEAHQISALNDEQEMNLDGKSNNNSHGKYLRMLQEVANLQRISITINLDDMIEFDETLDELVKRIMTNTSHYLNVFSKVIDELMPTCTTQTDMSSMDVIDVIVSHRKARQTNEQQSSVAEHAHLGGNTANTTTANATITNPMNMIPPILMRRYQLFFKSRTSKDFIPLAVRQVHANHVGGMVNIKGIITRVSEVRPLLQVGTYTCEQCGYEVYQEITSQTYMPAPECPSDACRLNQVRGQLVLQTRGSKFQKFQEARIQELTEQVPMGHIPRSMALVLIGDLTRSVNPGDQVIISGIYMPKPYTGFKAIKAGLLTDTYLLAQHVTSLKPKYDLKGSSSNDQIDAEMMAKIEELSRDPEVYHRLAKSIAPEIYGHVDVKRALLLLMVGGVTREMEDGMRIRGDINVCLMGDPGVAKSQLLKYITKIAPRAVYTTGKGSSGVGLTASVTKDPISNEMALEGGALVLADNGICCIDEFDKMDEGDRTAIHEVMEQQTISISKAGITTTLNARTSILAAANPLYGRYNPKKSPRENINLPPALLSRFDLLFLILDQANNEEDTRLAEHVCQVHRTSQAPQPADLDSIISADLFRAYIGVARRHMPAVPANLIEYVVGAYVGLRMNDLQQKDTTYTTPRTLLAVLRLSQALARIRFNPLVDQADIDEAMRLMELSRSSVDLHLDTRSNSKDNANPINKILSIIRDLAQRVEADENGRSVPMDLVRETVKVRGFNDEQLQQCLVAFDECNVWSISTDGTLLRIFN